LGRAGSGAGRQPCRRETLPWLEAKRRGYEGDFTLLLVVLLVLGSEKTLEDRSSHPEGQGRSQHQLSAPLKQRRTECGKPLEKSMDRAQDPGHPPSPGEREEETSPQVSCPSRAPHRQGTSQLGVLPSSRSAEQPTPGASTPFQK